MDAQPAQTPPPTTKLARTTSIDASGSGKILLNRYNLGRLLGRGTFAKVYHGRSLVDNTDVAIKVIDKTASVNADMEPRILREVSAMRRLNHPNILKLYEVMATKSKIFLVMELAPGGELFSKLARSGRFSESTARRYFHQLISALHFCHQNGVTHRDIKPHNLLLDQKGVLKISDFGLSALPEQLNNGLLNTACGTPAYTAPEVAAHKAYDGGKADAWSCGVLLYVFLVGHLPFDDRNLANMYRAILRRDFEMPEWLSKSAKNIIYKLLDPNPSTRLSIEGLMKLQWFRKSFKQETLEVNQGGNMFGEKDSNKHLSRVNAFDIISMSPGLDLSGLFEMGLSKKEMRFTSGSEVRVIEEKMVTLGGELGYRVERGKGGAIGLVKGRVALVVEILEVAPEIWLVEIKVVDGGMEFEDPQWEELRIGLTEVVISWYNDGS